MDLTEKKQIVEDLHERFSKSKVLIVTDYKGLDVSTIKRCGASCVKLTLNSRSSRIP